MSFDKDKAFWKHIEQRFKGKVYKIERTNDPMYDEILVRIEFHIPADEADEIEVYKRIIKVIEVVTEGDDDT